MDEAAQDILESEMPQVDLTKPIKSKRKKPSVNANAPSPEELERQMEALLFASARRVTVDEIAKLLNSSEKQVEEAFQRLKQDYDSRTTSLMLLDEDRGYKFTIREAYMPVVQNVVVETELSKSVMETLAIIAYKHPCLQSEVTRIRTNKAYDHLHELEQLGYISREPHGRTRKIKLTPKFFEYFDLPKNKLKESFAAFEAVEQAISDQESENDRLKKEIKAQEKEAKDDADKQREEQEKEVEKLGNLEVFEEEVHKKRDQVEDEKVGKLEVYEGKEKEKSSDDSEGEDNAEESNANESEDTESDEGSEQEKEQPKPTEESYKKFLDSQEEDEPEHVDIKKPERPLISGSDDAVSQRVNAILGGAKNSEEEGSHLAGISSEDKERAKQKESSQEKEEDKSGIDHVEDEKGEGVDLIEHAQSNRSESKESEDDKQ